MNEGTRPNATPERPGDRWRIAKLADAIAHNSSTPPSSIERSVRNWLSGKCPQELEPIERALFGNNPAYADWRAEFRKAFKRAQLYTPPEASICDPGLCKGRDEDIARLVASLCTNGSGAAIIVLGDAGLGKTTLTEKVGVDERVMKRFGDRRWFVELEEAGSAEEVRSEIATAIGLEPSASIASIRQKLRTKAALLVLDNFETPLHADETETENLLCSLVAIPGLAVMISLRGRETIARVPWTTRMRLNPLPRDIARAVFLAIADNVEPADPDLEFFLDELAGVPLSLTLVAKRASGEESLATLRHEWERSGVKSVDSGATRTRRSSLVASIEFSLNSPLLDTNGKRLFSLLGQLPSGIAEEDAEILLGECYDDARRQLREVGLLRAGSRIDVLATVRDVSRRRHAPEAELIGKYSRYYLALITAEGKKIGRSGGAEALARLTPEIRNIRASITAAAKPHLVSLDSSLHLAAVGALETYGRALGVLLASEEHELEDLERACEMVGDIPGRARCLIARGHIARMRPSCHSAIRNFQSALAMLGAVDFGLRADCLWGLAEVARLQGSFDGSRGLYQESVELYRRVSSVRGEAQSLAGLADLERTRLEFETARNLYEVARDLFRREGYLTGEAHCVSGLATIAGTSKLYEKAHKLLEEARTLYRHCGNTVGERHSITEMADVAKRQGELEKSLKIFDDAIMQTRQAGDVRNEARIRIAVAEIYYEKHEHEQSKTAYLDALDISRNSDDNIAEYSCLIALSKLAINENDFETARKLCAASREVMHRVGYRDGETESVLMLAYIALLQNDYEKAQELYVEVRGLSGPVWAEAECLWGLAEIARMQGDNE